MTYNSMDMSDENSDKHRLITLPEAAELYGFDQRYLSELARKGRLAAKKYSRIWLTTPADVEAYIRSRQDRGVFRDDISVD